MGRSRVRILQGRHSFEFVEVVYKKAGVPQDRREAAIRCRRKMGYADRANQTFVIDI